MPNPEPPTPSPRATGPWHSIDIGDSKIDFARQCPKGDCLDAQTDQFLAVLKDPNADKSAKAPALKLVIHFVGNLHPPWHDEDNGDKGGSTRASSAGSASKSALRPESCTRKTANKR